MNTVDKGGHGHYEEIWKWFCEHERNNKTVVCIYIKFRNQVANDEPMNLLILRVRGQRSRPSLTSMEILVNVMNSEFSSSFGSHLANIMSVAHINQRSNWRMLAVLFKIEGQGHGQMST